MGSWCSSGHLWTAAAFTAPLLDRCGVACGGGGFVLRPSKA